MMNDDDDVKDENRQSTNKDLLHAGYRATAVSYVLASGWALAKSGVNAASCYTISGPLMAATLSYIILSNSGAAASQTKNYRLLASTTYKRLNLLLTQYGALGLILAGLVRQPTKVFWYVWAALSFFTMINALEGYAYGVRGWNLEGDLALVPKDLVQQVKDTAKSIFSIPSNLQSAEYWLCTVAVGSLAVSNLVEMIRLVVSRASPMTAVARLLSHHGRLVLLTGTSLMLQDAAERGRLQGTTFIQLNFLSAFVFGAMAGMWLLASLSLLLLLLLCDCASVFCIGWPSFSTYLLVGLWLSLLSRRSRWCHDTLGGDDCLVFSPNSRKWILGASL